MTDRRIGEPWSRRAAEAALDAAGGWGFFTPLFAGADATGVPDADVAGFVTLRDAAEGDAPDPTARRPAFERAAADLPPGP